MVRNFHLSLQKKLNVFDLDHNNYEQVRHHDGTLVGLVGFSGLSLCDNDALCEFVIHRMDFVSRNRDDASKGIKNPFLMNPVNRMQMEV